ncbi:MAG: CHAT domain-containing protein [Planctomycetales bacterium]|nr:CHAT domain-containing protein [Planctomycetales bacterium]
MFAGVNQPRKGLDDGILTAAEFATLDARGVELTVLSACETGMGTHASGEGLVGLRRALHIAGVKSVIASLWTVDDLATRDLMNRFYENLLLKRMGKLDALREAQLWMLRERGPRSAREVARGARLAKSANSRRSTQQRLAPHYWAAFVLSGDWR